MAPRADFTTPRANLGLANVIAARKVAPAGLPVASRAQTELNTLPVDYAVRMLRVSFRQIRPDRVNRLRSWMSELQNRADEVRQTFDNEGVSHEQAFLLDTLRGPVLVYVAEVADVERGARAFAESTLPIDVEHRQVMADVVLDEPEVELLYQLRR